MRERNRFWKSPDGHSREPRNFATALKFSIAADDITTRKAHRNAPKHHPHRMQPRLCTPDRRGAGSLDDGGDATQLHRLVQRERHIRRHATRLQCPDDESATEEVRNPLL